MWEYGCEKYKNLPDDEKQRLVDYRKQIIKYGKITASQVKSDWCYLVSNLTQDFFQKNLLN